MTCRYSLEFDSLSLTYDIKGTQLFILNYSTHIQEILYIYPYKYILYTYTHAYIHCYSHAYFYLLTCVVFLYSVNLANLPTASGRRSSNFPNSFGDLFPELCTNTGSKIVAEPPLSFSHGIPSALSFSNLSNFNFFSGLMVTGRGIPNPFLEGTLESKSDLMDSEVSGDLYEEGSELGIPSDWVVEPVCIAGSRVKTQ